MSVNFGNLRALLTPAELDEKNLDNAPDAAGGAFAGRLTRAMVPSPVPGAATGANMLTKGVPLVDVMALETLPLQASRVACVPRFWEAADLVTTGRTSADEEATSHVEGSQDATSKQSPEDRRERPTLYTPENVIAPAVAAPRREAPGLQAAPPPSQRPPTAKALQEKPTETPKERDPRPASILSKPPVPTGAPTTPAKVDMAPSLPPPAHPPRLTLTPSAPAPATKSSLARATAPVVATKPLVRDDAEATRSAPRPTVETMATSVGAAPTSQTLAPRTAAPATAGGDASVSQREPPLFSERTSELPLSQVQWSKGEARVSLQTDAGALSLHVRVKDGVADVAASGPAALRLDGKSKELTALLAKEGLMLGRFAAIDPHAAATLLTGTIADEGDATSCQEPDEEDGTGSADAGDKRRVSGERRRLRPPRRVHVKA